jgi:hypothetical protein
LETFRSPVPSSHTDEFRFSARRSRLSFLTLGDVNPATHLSGFGEFDFLGAAQTANSNESNSFNPRIRQLYMTVDQDDFGAHLLAGQAWTLATMNLVGIVPRTSGAAASAARSSCRLFQRCSKPISPA